MKKIEFAFAMVMTFISGLSMAIAYGRNGLFIKFTPFYVCVALLCWLVGSAIVILLAQSVEEKGIGNGISLILCFNILSRIPNNIQEYIATYAIGKGMLKALVYVGGLIVALYIFYVIAIYLQCGVLNVPLLQTKKSVSVMNDEGQSLSVLIFQMSSLLFTLHQFLQCHSLLRCFSEFRRREK